MTLQEFFESCADNPFWIVAYFLLIPVCAIVAGIVGKGEGHLNPFNYFYSTLIYLVSVPGIFAITLNIYLFLFERRSIMETDLYMQILPIVSMLATILIIRSNVSLDKIPGFDKIGGLFLMIFAVLVIMWIVDRTHIFVVAFTRMNFLWVILIFAALFLAFRYGAKKLLINTESK